MQQLQTEFEISERRACDVLDQPRIKDLRTGVETGNTQAVLDGGLDLFIEASLKSGL